MKNMHKKKILYVLLFISFLMLIASTLYLYSEKGKYIDKSDDLMSEFAQKDRAVSNLGKELQEVTNEYEELRTKNDELEKTKHDLIEKYEELKRELELEKQSLEIPDYVRYNESFELIYNLPNGTETYFGDNGTILVEKNFEKKEIIDKGINNKFASLPLISSSNKKLIYIAPFGFELNGDVYLYSLENETNRKIIDVSAVNETKDETAKELKWLDDERILLIIGFAAGTVTKGGDLYLYDIESDELSLIKDVTSSSNHEEIVDFVLDGNKITIEIIRWHKDFENFDTRFEEIKLN